MELLSPRFCSAILQKRLKDGPVIVAEMAVEKGAQTILFPVACRRQLNDLSDDMAARITIVYYTDVRDALLKSLID